MINNQALGYGWYSNRAGGGTALVATHHNIEKRLCDYIFCTKSCCQMGMTLSTHLKKLQVKNKNKSVLNTQHFKPHAAQLQLIWASRTYGL